MNTSANTASACCTPASAATRSAPGAGVTESLQKPLYTVGGNAEAYEVRVLLPGVPKSGVKIDLDENVLSIRGERQSATPEGWKTLHREISTQNFQLSLRLNVPVDDDKLTASVENGVLTVKLPVKEAAKPRQVQVQ